MDVITSHENADFDCLGAMIAAKRLYPDAELVFSGARERNLREFFVKSTVYAYDFCRVRDIDLDAIRRLILVDVRDSGRIGPFGAIARRHDVEVHVYDHHPDSPSDLSPTLAHIEPVGSSVTVLTRLFMERDIVPTADEATLMMLGLYEDTGSLTFSSTCEQDYQAAAFLLRHGANLNVVADFLTQELTSAQVSLLNELVRSCHPLRVHGVEVMLAEASTDHYVGDLAMLAHKLKDMENYNALILVVRMEDRVFMVARSRIPEVDVGAILREFGGGGHEYAASATVRDLPLPQVLERLRQVVARRVQPRDIARRLLSAPVKTLTAGQTVAEARSLFNRYNINAAPVVEQGRVLGLVSRQMAERAQHHGMAQVPVDEVMLRDFAAAAPDTDIHALQDIIVRHNQRLVPILEHDQLVGVVSRTDLMRFMVQGRERGEAQTEELHPGDPVLKRRQLGRMLRSDLPATTIALLRQLGEVAAELEQPIYLVGGVVRDLLLRRANLDLDLVVEGDGIHLAEVFASRHPCRVRSHQKFGTAVLIFPDGGKIDIASARLEYYDHPAALPHVEHASIRLDLYRRDFTVNTLAIALAPDHFGELLDFFGGLRDLRERSIRVLHSLSFVEDPTRVFRAIRFEQRLGFHMGGQTEFLLKNAVERGYLGRLNGPRVFNEVQLLLDEADPEPAVRRLAELDLLKYLSPHLSFDDSTARSFSEIRRALHWFELLYTGEPLRRWRIYLLALVRALPPEAVRAMIRHFNLGEADFALLTRQRRSGVSFLQRLERDFARQRRVRPSTVHRALRELPLELVLYLVSLATERVRPSLTQFVTDWRRQRPHVTGRDLQQAGIPPGPIYKELLDGALAARLDGQVTNRATALAWVRRQYARKTRPPREKR